MANGKVGDHPYTDIMVHGREVYSARADALIREVAALADDRTRRELADRLMREFNAYQNPDVGMLERILTEMRDRLQRESRDRGFEV
jgi:hypothetical protein